MGVEEGYTKSLAHAGRLRPPNVAMVKSRRSWTWLARLGAMALLVLLLVLSLQGSQLYSDYRSARQGFNTAGVQGAVFRSLTMSAATSSKDRRSHFNELMWMTMKQLESSQLAWEDEPTVNEVPLQVCLLTADVPFSVGHGGTATAFLMLAELLTGLGPGRVNVTLVGLQRPEAVLLNNHSHASCDADSTRALAAIGIHYDCLQADDLQTHGLRLVSTHYWEGHALAVLRWLDRNPGRCDILHGHEWGGVFAYLALVLQLDPDRYLGLHLMLGTHGGHMWSQIGLRQRPSDLGSLRVDHQEKLSVEWADTILSPSRYMLGYFATRGWRVEHRVVIPNIVKGYSRTGIRIISERKPVWQILFVGRLEERKGIRVFMDLIALLSASHYWKLKKDGHSQPPSVFMYGPSGAPIDGEDSEHWIKTRTRVGQWAMPVTVRFGVNRSELLIRLQEEGVLLVVPSLQENLPYVLAEAALLNVPTVTFDVGGSREVLKLHAEDHLTFCPNVSLAAMYHHVLSILSAGWHFTPKLAPSMIAADHLWRRWHHAYHKVHRLLASDNKRALVDRASSLALTAHIRTIVLPSDVSVSTADLLKQVCGADAGLPGVVDDDGEPNGESLILLLPAHFEIIPSRAWVANQTFARAFAGMNAAKRHMQAVVALTFGVQMDASSVSYSSAPTWLLYSKNPNYCELHFPIVIRRRALCQAFAVDVQVFPVFEPWILADVLSQQSLQMVTYPEVLFRYQQGMSVQRLAPHPQCQPWAVPIGRYREANMLDHLHKDVSEDLRDLYFPRKINQRQYTDLTLAIRMPTLHHSERGWSFTNGSIGQWKLGALNDDGVVHWFTWYPTQFRYGCTEFGTSYPFVDYHSVVHPCRDRNGGCCGGARKSSSLLRYTFSEEQSMTARSLQLRVTFSTQHPCGDGVHIRILLYTATHSNPEELLSYRTEVHAGEHGRTRGPMILPVRTFTPGTRVDIVVDPLDNQDCDGIYISVHVTE